MVRRAAKGEGDEADEGAAAAAAAPASPSKAKAGADLPPAAQLDVWISHQATALLGALSAADKASKGLLPAGKMQPVIVGQGCPVPDGRGRARGRRGADGAEPPGLNFTAVCVDAGVSTQRWRRHSRRPARATLTMRNGSRVRAHAGAGSGYRTGSPWRACLLVLQPARLPDRPR